MLRNLKAADEPLLKALIRLRADQDFILLREYLEEEVATMHIEAETEENGIRNGWRQGACQLLRELFSKQDKARDTLTTILKEV